MTLPAESAASVARLARVIAEDVNNHPRLPVGVGSLSLAVMYLADAVVALAAAVPVEEKQG